MALSRRSNSCLSPTIGWAQSVETDIASERSSLLQNEFVIAGISNTANFMEKSKAQLQLKLEAVELHNTSLASKVNELQAQINVQSLKLAVEKEENELLFHSCKELEEEVRSLELNLRKSRLQSEQNIRNIKVENDLMQRERIERLDVAHFLVETSLQDRKNAKSQIENLETQLMTIEENTIKEIDALNKEHASYKKKLQDENYLLLKELKYLRAMNNQLNNNVKEMEQLLRERQRDVVDLQKALEFGRDCAPPIQLDGGTTRSTICESSRQSRDSMHTGWPAGGPGKWTSGNLCFLCNDSTMTNFSKEDEKVEKSDDTSDNKSIVQTSHRFTKEEMLKVYVWLTAAAVKHNFRDVNIEKSLLIQLADAVPFWDLHNFYTRYLTSLREKDAKKIRNRSKQQRLFGWIR